MTVGYLADSFDMFNVRELDLIEQARAACTRLVVGVFTDDYAARVLGRRPVIPLAERLAIVRHVRGVDEVVAHDGIRAIRHVDLVLFRLADRLVADEVPADAAVVLTPRRETTSHVLRNALSSLESASTAVA